jgi:hypothetical protein
LIGVDIQRCDLSENGILARRWERSRIDTDDVVNTVEFDSVSVHAGDTAGRTCCRSGAGAIEIIRCGVLEGGGCDGIVELVVDLEIGGDVGVSLGC